ncbi:conserved hypothetical protein [Parafrankia sp. EAN1pec]|uniref:hypothetical protein n=1 Tax=Parafrankia sp. (strain EAN1pec) TaxID=298653 RepID=UPI00005409A4|nr:conserved hypothetical protein [Frankia sp. EAN1pec]
MTVDPRTQPDDGLLADLAWLGAIQDTPGVLETFVAGHAPRMFALVEQDVGMLEDTVFGWGLQFSDHAFVVARGGTFSTSCSHAEDAVRIFAVAGWNLRLVWHTPPTPASSARGRGLRKRQRVIR